MYRAGRLTCDPQSALDAVIAVHDVLRAEGRALDGRRPSQARAMVLRAVEVRDLVRAGLWPD